MSHAYFRRAVYKLKGLRYEKKERNALSQGGALTHVTYYLATNAGDTVLSKCVRRTFEVLGGWDKWDLVGVKEPVTDRTVDACNNTKGIVIGGGGLFLPDTNKNDVSGWQWAVDRSQIDAFRVPIIVYSVGYNYFRGQEASQMFRENVEHLIEKAAFVGLRNQGSIRELGKLLSPEAAGKLVWQPCTTTIARKLFAGELPAKRQTRRVAFNMAFDRASLRFGDKKDLILSQVAKAAKRIEQKGYQIVYVLHCRADGDFIPYLKAEDVRFETVSLCFSLPMEVLRFYNNMDVTIGMRGHAQMIPFGLNGEIISLGTHEKMRWFLEDIDAADWYVELTESPETLSDRIVDTFTAVHETDGERTRARLLEQQERLWDVTRENWQTIDRVLK